MALAVVDEKLKKELKDALELMVTHCVINDAICLYHVISKNELPQEYDQTSLTGGFKSERFLH